MWMLVYVISIVALAYLIWYFAFQKEEFASGAEKKAQLKSWFEANPEGTYKEFRRQFPRADIVDFETGRQ
jgi:hypothetical protein